MKKNNLDRRHFLRGTGTLIALPALESVGFRRFASAAETASANSSTSLSKASHFKRSNLKPRGTSRAVPKQKEFYSHEQ
jgi:hypothetical protein